MNEQTISEIIIALENNGLTIKNNIIQNAIPLSSDAKQTTIRGNINITVMIAHNQ